MDTSIIRKLLEQLNSYPTLCNWSQLYSIITWNKLRFAHTSKRFRLNETSITQDLVFQFYILATTSHLTVEIFESQNEKANGNDLEIFIETNNGYVLFPTQAKILSTTNRYQQIYHAVKGIPQIDLLLDYAKKQQGLPLYLFYNYVFDPTWQEEDDSISEGLGSIELYGCAFTLAQTVKDKFYNKKKTKKGLPKWSIPSFQDLFPEVGFPFHYLFCALVGSDLSLWKEVLGKEVLDQVRFYEKDEIIENTLWQNLAPPDSIGRIHSDDRKIYQQEKPAFDQRVFFNPKFRLVIPINRRQPSLYRIS